MTLSPGNAYTLPNIECKHCKFWSPVKLKVQKIAKYGDCTNQRAISEVRTKGTMTTSTHSCDYGEERDLLS